jgi:hypothetical protein
VVTRLAVPSTSAGVNAHPQRDITSFGLWTTLSSGVVDARNAVFVRSPRVSAVGETRRTTRLIALAALGASTAIAAAGCSLHDASPPSAVASPTGTSTRSEEAILADAIDAYTRYSAALDAVLARGDGDYSALKDWTTSDYLTRLSEDDLFAQNGWVTEGSTSFDSEQLVSRSPETVTVRLCRDVSRVRVKDASGVDVTPKERDDRFVVTVSLVGTEESSLLVDSSERDAEDDSCER